MKPRIVCVIPIITALLKIKSKEGDPDVRVENTFPNSMAGIDARAAFPTAPIKATKNIGQWKSACPATQRKGLDFQVLYLNGIENSLTVIIILEIYCTVSLSKSPDFEHFSKFSPNFAGYSIETQIPGIA